MCQGESTVRTLYYSYAQTILSCLYSVAEKVQFPVLKILLDESRSNFQFLKNCIGFT